MPALTRDNTPSIVQLQSYTSKATLTANHFETGCFK